MHTHNVTRKEIKMISKIILENLIDSATKLYPTFIPTKYSYLCHFVKYHIGARKTGHPVEEPKSTRRHVASFNS